MEKLPFLIEMGCEELPARFVLPLATALAEGMKAGLAQRGITHDEAQIFATPRRIAVLFGQLNTEQPAQTHLRKGPKLTQAYQNGVPTPAALGFAKSCGVDFAQITNDGAQLIYQSQTAGKPTAELIPDIFHETLQRMDNIVPKRMRWGASEATFVRPVLWLTALLGEHIIPIEAFGLIASRQTFGHRFHAPQAITLDHAKQYQTALHHAHVVADFAQRRALIREGIVEKAQTLSGAARITDELLDEVTALVEKPVVIAGAIEARFLALPPEVIVATVETNQRYFTVFDKQKQLLPYFITVSNIDSRDMAQVIAGNERVVRPRLSDAMFFWEQDLKNPLENNVTRLDQVTFHKDLGSIGDKVRRIGQLSAQFYPYLPENTRNEHALLTPLARAAQLCKTDLLTKMVYEFPELQGLMGGYYAQAQQENPAVATAIQEHYAPTQQGTSIPSTRVGQFLSLADKLDTLVGIFATGFKPSGSKDPYGLRRATLGILRIILEAHLPFDLKNLIQHARDTYPSDIQAKANVDEILQYCTERLRGMVLETGARKEVFEAVLAKQITEPNDFMQRVNAVQQFWSMPEAPQLAEAQKRARNILRNNHFESKHPTIHPHLLQENAEKNLWTAMQTSQKQVDANMARGDYAAALQALASLSAPVDAFFTEVMVMVEDVQVRENRLGLLAELNQQCLRVAEIGLLPG